MGQQIKIGRPDDRSPYFTESMTYQNRLFQHIINCIIQMDRVKMILVKCLDHAKNKIPVRRNVHKYCDRCPPQISVCNDAVISVSFLFPATVALYDRIIKVSLAPSLYSCHIKLSIFSFCPGQACYLFLSAPTEGGRQKL